MDDCLALALVDWLRNPTVRLIVVDAQEVKDLRATVDRLTQERDRVVALYGQEVQVNLRLKDDLRAAQK